MTSDRRLKRWQRLLATETKTQLSSISIASSQVFVSQTIKFDRVTVLTGYHGTGKSLLLLIIEALFGYTVPMSLPPAIKCENSRYDDVREHVSGVIEATVATKDGQFVRRIDLGDPAKQRLAAWSDALVEGVPLTDDWWPQYCGPVYAFSELHGLRDHAASEGVLAKYERYDLSAEDLRGLKGVLGRQYDRVTVYRVSTDVLDGWDYPIPVAFAERGQRTLNSSKMSAGELWVHYLFWFLRTVNEGSLVLIDEPEAFISPRGQRALVDEIARYCLARKLQLVVATHSSEILSRIPLGNIRMCVSSVDKVRVVTPTSIMQVQDTVGIRSRIRGVLFVEDEAAATILGSIFALLDMSLAREFELVAAGGESNALAGLRCLRQAKRLAVAAVLDGDQRKLDSEDLGIFYLPGHRAPEYELLDLSDEGLTELAGTLGKSVDDLTIAVSNAAILEHQYQIGRFAEELGLTEQLIWHSLAVAWMKRPEIARSARQLVDDLRQMLDRQP
ncbi:ATP-dependent endonuclease [Micromonospora olivasterospora]|uniref:ATP-dependent nuclease n=1 Tax=Micromonospora olivasterospora TaxID=1880 RepID=UPI0014786871|nr:AAA family ATPase [Micromonospora olivasterospora]